MGSFLMRSSPKRANATPEKRSGVSSKTCLMYWSITIPTIQGAMLRMICQPSWVLSQSILTEQTLFQTHVCGDWLSMSASKNWMRDLKIIYIPNYQALISIHGLTCKAAIKFDLKSKASESLIQCRQIMVFYHVYFKVPFQSAHIVQVLLYGKWRSPCRQFHQDWWVTLPSCHGYSYHPRLPAENTWFVQSDSFSLLITFTIVVTMVHLMDTVG